MAFDELICDSGNCRESSLAESRNIWFTIWSLNVPPKVRYFLWLLVKNILPTRSNLRNRHMEVDGRCPLCGKFNETVELFLVSHSVAELV